MTRPWWIPVLQWALWLVVMASVMAWVGRSRSRTRPQSGTRRLEPPTSILVLGLIGVVFFGGITVISNTIGRNRTTTIWTTLTFLVFALASSTMVLEYFFGRHRVSELGMEHRSMFGRRRPFAWSDVREVRYNTLMKWFAIGLHSGSTVRVSAMVAGLPELARLLLEHVPRSAFDDQTFETLCETEQGRLPEVWG